MKANSSAALVLANSAERTYDAWGSVRQGASSGGERGRYVANLGHVQDDESALIYMRARFYEPSTGRFVSQDPARDGINWYVYCGDDPVNNIDATGKVMWAISDLAALFMTIFAYLVAITAEGEAVLGIVGIGGSMPVMVAAIFAGAVLSIVGAILTVNAIIGSFRDINE